MRYVGILLVILSLPGFFIWLQSDNRNYRFAYILIGLFPFLSGALNLDASLWHIGGLGYVKGIVVTLLDTLCLAILLNKAKGVFRYPFTGLLVAYLSATLLSILQADGLMAPLSYAFQLMRIIIVFWTVAIVVQEDGALRYVAYGLAIGAMIQGVVTVGQRLGGTFQATGLMGHQNLTGMMLHFATLPLLAMLLAGARSKIYAGGVAGGLVAVALGASRGSIAFLGLGLGLLILLSIMRRATSRKYAVAGLSVLMLAAASPIIISGLDQRLSNVAQRESAEEERTAFEAAAAMMIADHPFGVGANRYTFIANVGGYSERAGVTWAGSSRSAVVHHLYYLTAAELGWLGLFALILLFLGVVIRGLHFSFRYRRDPAGDIALGCTCAVVALAAQSFFEWVFVAVQTQYVFAIAIGIIAGSIRNRERLQRRKSKARRAQIAEREQALAASHG